MSLPGSQIDQIIAGHKKHGDAAFKQSLHPDTKHAGGPPVRVSFSARPGNSCNKTLSELRRHRKFTAVQWANTST